MDQPKGFVKKGEEHKVCHLKKALCGLKQVGRQWYKRLRTSMISWGFSEFICRDIAIFTKINEEGNTTIILVYINDMAAFASSLKLLINFKVQIATEYKFSDMGEISHFLGLHITQDHEARTVTINQLHYINKMLKHFNMQTTILKNTLLPHTTKLVMSESPQSNPSMQRYYQSMVGSLMYAMLGSHPDICFSVNKLSQFGSNPNEEHLAATVCILQYLKKTRNLRLVYDGYGGSELYGWSNLDWASDPDTHHSTTGYVFQINGGSIAWATQKQRTIALSSTESEYMAILESAKHTIWTIQLFHNLKIEVDLLISIHCDSKGACNIASNNVFHKCTKHIDIQHHFICEKMQEGILALVEVDSDKNTADVLTKSLTDPAHW
jgi:hypothetical protein